MLDSLLNCPLLYACKIKHLLPAESCAKEATTSCLQPVRTSLGKLLPKHVSINALTMQHCSLAESFAKEATAALHEAADQMPQAAATQLNGKQLKALRKKQKAQKAALPAQALLSEQKHQAQLAGAAEAVPLKLKQKKLAQQQPDANGLLGIDSNLQQQQQQQQEQSDRPAKKQKKSKQIPSKSAPAANGNTHVHSTADAIANGHGADVPTSPTTQKKKVRFSMKRNLLMQIGGAVPPENIRTPPDSRPKVRTHCSGFLMCVSM